jgi:exoribonuclease II
VVRNDAHRLIEECMLAANVCAADFLLKSKQKCLYRVHEGPTPEKLENLRNYLQLVGLTLAGNDKPTAKDYAKLAEQIHGRPDAPVLQTMLLRSMQQAVYTPDNNGTLVWLMMPTRISPHRFAVILTCWSIAPSRRYCRVINTSPVNGRNWVCIAQ